METNTYIQFESFIGKFFTITIRGTSKSSVVEFLDQVRNYIDQNPNSILVETWDSLMSLRDGKDMLVATIKRPME